MVVNIPLKPECPHYYEINIIATQMISKKIYMIKVINIANIINLKINTQVLKPLMDNDFNRDGSPFVHIPVLLLHVHHHHRHRVLYFLKIVL